MALGLRLRKQLAMRITTDKKISRDKRRHHETKEVDQEDREDPGQAGEEELDEEPHWSRQRQRVSGGT
ncbi:GD20469 [Drosophila simulans]|uniref:GD20469 n=1 Tax=Drosophila simulans TaxID=7240 RepID=B4R0K0_DROSI|nr:GD20469 [Drosophila simulans]